MGISYNKTVVDPEETAPPLQLAAGGIFFKLPAYAAADAKSLAAARADNGIIQTY